MKTYISGVPHGFNLYENEAGMYNYFLSFYVSSRKGRRLMINRRKNGDTIYSYIQYGINDEVGRGRNSFFSMSLLFENGEYTADFKILLDFFDKLFEKIISDEIILTKDKKYKIAKFSDARDYVEKIKAVITEFVSNSKIKIESYDDTFLRPSSYEKVAEFGDNKVSDNTLLQVLKNYAWVSASNIDNTPNPDPIPNPNPDPIPIIIELNRGELEGKSNDIRNLLLDIYENPNKYSYNDKTVIRDTIKETIGNIEAYLKTIISNEEEYKVFDDIYKTYNKQLNSINKIIEGPNPETYKTCKHCNANKYISDFSSPEVEICKECEAKTKERICLKCREQKGVDEFYANEPYTCKECLSKEIRITPPKPDSLIQKYKFHIVIAFAFSLIVFVALILTNTISFGGNDKKQDKDKIEKNIDKRKLNNILSSISNSKYTDSMAKYIDSLDTYIRNLELSKDDSSYVKKELENTLVILLNIDTTNTTFDISQYDKENKYKKLLEGFGSKYLTNIANDYNKLQNPSNPKDTIDSICKLYKGIPAFDKFYNETINNQDSETNGNNSSQSTNKNIPVPSTNNPVDEKKKTEPKKEDKKTPVPVYTLTYVTVDNKKTTIKLSPSKNGIGFDAKIGSQFTVTCTNGKIKANNKSKYTGKVTNEAIIINLTGEKNMVLTITGKIKGV